MWGGSRLTDRAYRRSCSRRRPRPPARRPRMQISTQGGRGRAEAFYLAVTDSVRQPGPCARNRGRIAKARAGRGPGPRVRWPCAIPGPGTDAHPGASTGMHQARWNAHSGAQTARPATPMILSHGNYVLIEHRHEGRARVIKFRSRGNVSGGWSTAGARRCAYRIEKRPRGRRLPAGG